MSRGPSGIDERASSAPNRHEISDAPQIDGVVRIEAARTLRAGDFAWVRIVAADDYDLTGRLE